MLPWLLYNTGGNKNVRIISFETTAGAVPTAPVESEDLSLVSVNIMIKIVDYGFEQMFCCGGSLFWKECNRSVDLF